MRHFWLWLAALGLLGCAGLTPQSRPNPGGQSEPVLFALAMIGAPYRFGGAQLGGFDCSGLSRFVYAQSLGIDLPRSAREQSEWPGRRVSRAQLAPGDLVFFSTHSQSISHVGIYAGEARFIHAPSAGSNVRLQALDDPYWSPRFRFGIRVVGAR